MPLWNKNEEKLFFEKSDISASPNQLFYTTDDGRYVAYWPKGYCGAKYSLQSRNFLIGDFTEKWTGSLLRNILNDESLHVIRQAQIPAIGITRKSPADLVIASKNTKVLMPDDVKMIFEVKMSLVWNW